MNEITITSDPRSYNDRLVGGRLIMRTFGWWRRVLIPLSALLTYFIGAAFVHIALGLNMLSSVALYGMYLFYFSIFVFMLTIAYLNKYIDKIAADAPYRKKPLTITMSNEGVQTNGTMRRWSEYTAIEEFPKMTVLVLSPRFFTVIPDADLPNGLTPENLRIQLNEWRDL